MYNVHSDRIDLVLSQGSTWPDDVEVSVKYWTKGDTVGF